jgi:vacuolar-type H+-ATPase subunit E/Vma4
MEAKEIVEESLEQAQKIVKDAEQEAAKIRERKTKETQDRFQEKETSVLESAKLAEKRKVSALRTELLEQAIREATAKLERMSREESSRYKESLGKLIIEAAEAVQTSDLEILANSADQEFVQGELPELRKKLQKRKGKLPTLKLSEEKLACLGGIIVQDRDKKRIFNNTFEARLTKTKQEIGNKLFSDVFEGKDN